jgi:Flp pilus assembly protein TadD
VDAFLQLARIENVQGSADKALNYYQQAIQKNPQDVRGYVMEGMLQESRGDWSAAEKLYQQALDARPNYPVAANNLAFLMLEHGGDKNVALSMAQTARRGMPTIPQTADTLGWAYYYTGVYSSAISLLQEAIKANPQDINYHYHLAVVYQKTGNSDSAKQEFDRALALHPTGTQLDAIHKAMSSAGS